MTANLSPCCGADIIVAGHGMTHWYACEACGKEIPDQVRVCPTCWVECVTVDGVRACPACKQAVEA